MQKRNDKHVKNAAWNVHELHGDGVRTDTLPEGTRITLAKNSVLYYTLPFDVYGRSVKLAGGGFFSIAHDPARPSWVEVNDLYIEHQDYTRFKVTPMGICCC